MATILEADTSETYPKTASSTTNTKRVDANDYSRFDKIDVSDEEQENEKQRTAKAVTKCRNCDKENSKMKCSICKKASYCNRKCQLEDWTFHKRICKKPEAAKENPRPPSSSANALKKADSTTAKAVDTKPRSTKKTKESEKVLVEDTELENAKGYKNGLPYFHRELSSKEKELIGDTAPKKVEISGLTSSDRATHAGSAWNAAGTFEERNYTTWAKQKLSDMLASLTYTEGEATATCKAPRKMTGEASICVVRFKKRFLFDFSFELPFKIVVENKQVYKGSFQMNEISNDEDYEISYTLSEQPNDSATKEFLRDFLGKKDCGLQREALRVIADFLKEFQQQ